MSLPWVLVDLSAMAHRAMHSVGDLSMEDIPTGVIFGFFHQLRRACLDRRVRSNRIAIFCDSRTSLRAMVYPDYKKKRAEDRTEEEWAKIRAMKKQVDALSEGILQDIGFPVYKQEGLESDDIMADAADRVSENPFERGVMVTSDGDLFQCITERVHWFDPQRDSYYDPETFLAARGVKPTAWGDVKALAGCKTDNVAGVRGVGEKTAIRFLTGDLPPSHKTYKDITSTAGRTIVKRNKGLVLLPHIKTRDVELKEPDLKSKVFFRYCESFGLESILRERDGWESFLHGTLFKTRKRGEA